MICNAIITHYILMQGLELFRHGGSSMFLVLPSPRERNTLYDRLLTLKPSIRLSDEELGRLTHRWQLGELSNYDYLMMLNQYVVIHY